MASVCVYGGEALGRYGFPDGHPFGLWRMQAFWGELVRSQLHRQICVQPPVMATQAEIERFHEHTYVERVKAQSVNGTGYLDYGDTPAFPGVYEAAATVVGTGLDALHRILSGECRRAFVPIGGLHHARREGAAGFCVFNDCGVVIETLLAEHHMTRIAYVDIDAHHGDGVYYGFVGDSRVYIADMHEDGRYLYPGTGAAHETGRGAAAGTKLNIPVAPGADHSAFMKLWPTIEDFIRQAKPEFILLQCGADSLAGDPLTHLRLCADSHYHATRQLCLLAEEYCQGRILAMGGGGYDAANIASAWTAVVRAMLETPAGP
ncbi:MAG: histone deacetylase [Gammaproteobacteria bacterium RBG_16_57_12]|nr:MAG: histone deacetylase [Gammaproteobacteria bacterium RBG_16_57_12]